MPFQLKGMLLQSGICNKFDHFSTSIEKKETILDMIHNHDCEYNYAFPRAENYLSIRCHLFL